MTLRSRSPKPQDRAAMGCCRIWIPYRIRGTGKTPLLLEGVEGPDCSSCFGTSLSVSLRMPEIVTRPGAWGGMFEGWLMLVSRRAGVGRS